MKIERALDPTTLYPIKKPERPTYTERAVNPEEERKQSKDQNQEGERDQKEDPSLPNYGHGDARGKNPAKPGGINVVA